MLRIRSKNEQKPSSKKLVSKSDMSVLIGRMPLMSALVYIINALIAAEFKEMSSDEFKDTFLCPLDNALRESSIKSRLLVKTIAIHGAIQCMWNKLSKNTLIEK